MVQGLGFRVRRYWVAVEELALSYQNGYIYIYMVQGLGFRVRPYCVAVKKFRLSCHNGYIYI